jgi:hypothetical protein
MKIEKFIVISIPFVSYFDSIKDILEEAQFITQLFSGSSKYILVRFLSCKMKEGPIPDVK